MSKLILKRALQAVITLFFVLLVIFVMVRATGDPALLMLPLTASDEDVAQMRHKLGTDRPIPVQFATYLRQVSTGNLGDSLRFREPVLKVIGNRLPSSLELAGASMGLAILAAVVLGTIAATMRNTPLDAIVRLLSILGQSLPSFWVGIVFVEIFAVTFGVLPVAGSGSLKHLILPAVVLGWNVSAGMMRLLRANLIEVLASDYTRTAKSKGLGPLVVLGRHAIPNAILPVVSLAGIYFALLITNAIVVETVFARPGIGSLAYQAILSRDFPLIQAIVLVAALFIIASNLVTDILYGVIDPRIRVS